MLELTQKEILKVKKNYPKDVGIRIKFFRNKLNLSQTELANLTGKDRQYIYKIEKGKVTPNISTIKIVVTALEISMVEFFKDL